MIAGIDEVGRGCLAGPVVAACVVFRSDPPDGLVDSKTIGDSRRRELDHLIRASAWVSIASASINEITELNILHATMLAMRRAHEGLPSGAAHSMILIDGNRIPDGLAAPARAVVKGDATVSQIAAASIIAKVHRDDLMQDLHREHPYYAWDKNKGYGSPSHLSALAEQGATKHHRPTFAPVRAAVERRAIQRPA